jgi:hypothetical protein
MFARCFADPTKSILGLCEKTRRVRAHRENLQRQGSNLQKNPGCHAGAPWEQLMRIPPHTHHRRGLRKRSEMRWAYGKSSTTSKPVTRIRQLIRAPRKATPAGRSQRLRLHVQQPAHCRVPLDALQARLLRTCARGRNTLVRRATRPLAFVRIRLRTSGDFICIYTYIYI